MEVIEAKKGKAAQLFAWAKKLGVAEAFLKVWESPARAVFLVPSGLSFRHRLRREIEAHQDRNLIEQTADTLKSQGFAQFHVADITSQPIDFQSMQAEVSSIMEESSNETGGSKDYIRRIIDDNLSDFPAFDHLRKWAQNRMLYLTAARYLDLAPHLVSFKVWQSFKNPEQGSERLASQNWHRDFSEQRLVRVFLNLGPVDEANGATQYIRGSHSKGPLALVGNKRNVPGSPSRYLDLLREPFSTSEFKVAAEGPPGQITLIDTGGIHRGGWHLDERNRIVAITTFVTPLDLYGGKLHL